MPDRHILPHLLKLLDDDSADIRDAVTQQLVAYGADLPLAIADMPEPPPAHLMPTINGLIESMNVDLGPQPELLSIERRFAIGQLVMHRRYRYRGVVVGLDLSCQADNDWYHANRTQPERNQPWYHVLVHDTDQVTYAAQSSLKPDRNVDLITHPLIDQFFSDFSDGRYLRNDRPWPLT